MAGTLVVKVLGETVQQSELTFSDCYVTDVLQLSQERKYYRDKSTLGMCHFSQKRKEGTFHSLKKPGLLKEHRWLN